MKNKWLFKLVNLIAHTIFILLIIACFWMAWRKEGTVGKLIIFIPALFLLLWTYAKQPIRWFWWSTDYGKSTGRLIMMFIFFALLFANIYYWWGRFDINNGSSEPGIICDLFADKDGPLPNWLVSVRAVYFSIVTMTTLGFGDMYAKSRSVMGHVLLTMQVLLGYLLLGSLITRLNILFTAGGPAGKFEKQRNRKP